MITPKRNPNDKSGIGFDNNNAFVYKPRYNKVSYNYNNDRHGRNNVRRPNTYMHNNCFEKKNNNRTFNYEFQSTEKVKNTVQRKSVA